MLNLNTPNHSKTYNNFTDHPLAPTYFKYIDFLISRNHHQQARRLLNIANSPLTNQNILIITDILAKIHQATITDNFNEFEALNHQLD
jgi:hypothetical protein